MPISEARLRIGEELRGRFDEIEQAMYARGGVFTLESDVDTEYALGLKESISVALEYGIRCIESSERTLPPIPLQLYAQARLAARNGVEVTAVLGRYLAGYTLLDVFLEEAAEAEGLVGSKALREIRRTSALVIDRLVKEICEQHTDELRKQAESRESSRLLAIRDLLGGEQVDQGQFNYDFAGFHVGLVANGPHSTRALRGLAEALDCIPLSVSLSDTTTWGWLGRRKTIDIERIGKLVAEHWPSRSAIAIGEVNHGLTGWRLTHRQARAGLLVSARRGGAPFRYGEDPMLVTALRDPLAVESYKRMYLDPLSAMNDSETYIETLDAFFAANQNGASAAAQLGVRRQTVAYRLQRVEAALGCILADKAAEIGAALRLDRL